MAHRFHLEVIGEGDLALADEIFAPDCTIHMHGTSDVKGPARAKEIARGDQRAFPKGMTFVHDTVVAEGDLVAFRWTLKGIRESGEESLSAGLDIVRIENGKIAELWIEYHSVGRQ